MKDELLKNTLIVGIGRVSTQFIGLLLLPLYTNFLLPSQYGQLDLIITYTALLLPLATLSLEQAAFRLLVDSRQDDGRTTAIISTVTRTILALGLTITIASLAIGYTYGISITGLAVLYATSFILLHVCLWLARGLGNSLAYSKGSLLVGLTTLVLSSVFVVVLHWGLAGILLALALANLVGCFYFYLSLKLYHYVKLTTYDKQLNKELLSYSLPLVPNSVSWWLVNAVDRTIIALMIGVAATGIYAVSVKFAAILMGFFFIFWVSWHESASIHIDHPDRDTFFSKVTNSTILLFGSLALVILAGVSLTFDWIVGSDFSQAYIYIPILMFGAVCNAVVTLYGSVYAAKKKTRQILNTTLLAAVINVVLMLALIPFIGLMASALASVAAYLSMTIYRHFDIRKYVIIHLDVLKIAIFSLATIISLSLYYINNPWLNLVNVFLACAIMLAFNKGIILSVKEIVWQKVHKS